MSGNMDLLSSGKKDGAKARIAYKESSAEIKKALDESAAQIKKAVGK